MFYKKPVKKSNPMVLAVSIVVLFILMIASIISISMLNKNKNQSTNQTLNYTINQEIITQGNISKSDNLGLYTHVLANDTEKFGLKSKTIDLNQWEGFVYIKGTVEDIKNNIPIIEVSDINYYGFDEKNTDELSGDEQQEDVSDQTNFDFPEYGFYIDFGDSTDYTVKNEDDKIIIQKINQNVEGTSGENQTGNNLDNIFSITAYKCVPGDSLKDCQKILDNSKKFGYSEFKTTAGITFYNISETENRNFFNGTKWGYRVESTGDVKFEKIAKYIHIYDDDYIKTKLAPNIKSTCKDYKNQLQTPTNYNIYMQDEKLIAEITGTDDKNNVIDCVLEVKLGSTIVGKLLNIENQGSATKDQVSITTGNNQTGDQTQREGLEEVLTTQETEDVNLTGTSTEPANMLKFESSQGYIIYLPRSTSFERQVLSSTENLGIAGLKCNSKVNVINAKQKDSLNTNPSAEIYICTTNLDDSSIQKSLGSQDIIYKKGTTSDTKYFVKYNDAEGAKIANEIVVN